MRLMMSNMPKKCLGNRFITGAVLGLWMCAVSAVVAQEAPQQYKPVGSATLRVLWFDIYSAELRSPNGVFYEMKGLLLLKLTYLRHIKKQKLLDETATQLKFDKPILVTGWMSQLEDIWPDIGKGDQLWFYLDAGGEGHFYLNERYIGSINDIRFGTAFISIWLAEDSSYPDLARKLRGET